MILAINTPRHIERRNDVKKPLFVLTILAALGASYLVRSGYFDEEVYAYVPTTDGGSIPVPYARPDRDEYMAEQAAYKREVPESSGDIIVGSRAVVPGWQWVEITNESPVTQQFSNGTAELNETDTCGIEMGGLATVTEDHGDTVTVEYTAPGDPAGTPCPSGVRFMMSKTDFAGMNDSYVAARDAIQTEKDLVKQLLDRNFYGEERDAGGWRWVDVVNAEPITQRFSNGHGYLAYGETCGTGRSEYDGRVLSEGGTVQVRGEANGKVLYEYTAHGNPMGTPCPSGILFFN